MRNRINSLKKMYKIGNRTTKNKSILKTMLIGNYIAVELLLSFCDRVSTFFFFLHLLEKSDLVSIDFLALNKIRKK